MGSEKKSSIEEKDVKEAKQPKKQTASKKATKKEVENVENVEKKSEGVKEDLKKESADAKSSAETAKEKVVANASVKKSKKRVRRQVTRGQAHIRCSYNNTAITLSDTHGETLAWSSAGLLGFKGAKKSTAYAATKIVADAVEKTKRYQLKEVEVFVRGIGSGREAAVRALSNNGLELVSICDVTPVAHNGCRSRRPRRV